MAKGLAYVLIEPSYLKTFHVVDFLLYKGVSNVQVEILKIVNVCLRNLFYSRITLLRLIYLFIYSEYILFIKRAIQLIIMQCW